MNDPSEGVADDICGLAVANDVPEAALHEEIGNSQHGEIGSHLHGCIQTSGEDLSMCSSSCSSFADNIKKGLEIERLEEELRVERESFNNLLLSQSGRVSLVKKIAKIENPLLLQDCRNAIMHSQSSQTLTSMLEIPPGCITKRTYNPVVSAFVSGITEAKESSESSKNMRMMRQHSCIETLYSARHLKYVSEFHLVFQAVAYAICGSKLVVDMIGI